MTTLSTERRAENLRLREAATPGLIEASKHCDFILDSHGIAYVAKMVNQDDDPACFVREQRLANRAYIVAACNDLPLYEAALVEAEREIERLKAELSRVRFSTGNFKPPVADTLDDTISYSMRKGTP